MSKKIDIGAFSAYAIAVEHGYTGSETQWINAQEAARIDSEHSAQVAKEYSESAAADSISANAAKDAAALSEVSASQHATTAANASATAISAKSSAEEANRVAAVSKEAAVSAKNEAVDAKNIAVDAKIESIRVKQDVTEKYLDIVSNYNSVASYTERAKGYMDSAYLDKVATAQHCTDAKAARDQAVPAATAATSARDQIVQIQQVLTPAMEQASANVTRAEEAAASVPIGYEDLVAEITEELVTKESEATNNTVLSYDTNGVEYEVPTMDELVAVRADLADQYRNDKIYAVGDICMYDGKIYRCNTAITTAEAWTSSHWNQTTVGAQLECNSSGLAEMDAAFYESEYRYTDVDLTEELGKFWLMDGNDSSWQNAHRSKNLVEVTEGETIKVFTRIYTNIAGVIFFRDQPLKKANFAGYALYDIPSGSSTRDYTDEEVTVPNGAKYVVVQGKTDHDLVLKKYVKNAKIETLDRKLSEFEESADFERDNLIRRIWNIENSTPFTWKPFDKSYFVFSIDDANHKMVEYINLFASENVPLSCSVIYSNLTEDKIASLKTMVESSTGGEVLTHYSGSPTDASTDAEWLRCTRDAKKAIEGLGFVTRGIVRADQTATSTEKGEKYCRKYFDFADDAMGKSAQYNLHRTGLWTISTVDDLKTIIDTRAETNQYTGFGFHGGVSPDKSWVTPDNIRAIIQYIKAKPNCEITTYSFLYDHFGTYGVNSSSSN